MAKNLQSKTRNLSKGEKPYEVWESRGWRWEVLKKWQADDNKPYARWFCRVITPMTGDGGELGDVYVADIKSIAMQTEVNP